MDLHQTKGFVLHEAQRLNNNKLDLQLSSCPYVSTFFAWGLFMTMSKISVAGSRAFWRTLFFLLFSVIGLTGNSIAQEGEPSPEMQRLLKRVAETEWTVGPAECQIGSVARIKIPAGFRFIGANGARALVELYGNPPDNSVLAAILPTDEASDWTLFFQFDDVGYVKDEEKDTLNADSILSSMRETIGPQNSERRSLGLEEMQNMSWSRPPFYDPVTNNLNWGLRLHFPSGDSVNYDIRILGRYGVMEATLLDSPETFAQSVPTINTLLEGFEFNPGNKYAEWKAGDRVAAYGLTGLVAGGAAVVAAKTGLLAKLFAGIAKGGKAIVLVLAAIVFGLFSFIKRIFGGGSKENSQASG